MIPVDSSRTRRVPAYQKRSQRFALPPRLTRDLSVDPHRLTAALLLTQVHAPKEFLRLVPKEFLLFVLRLLTEERDLRQAKMELLLINILAERRSLDGRSWGNTTRSTLPPIV